MNSECSQTDAESEPSLKNAIILFNIPEAEYSVLLTHLNEQTKLQILKFNSIHECTNSILESYSETQLALLAPVVMNSDVQILREFLPQIEFVKFVDNVSDKNLEVKTNMLGCETQSAIVYFINDLYTTSNQRLVQKSTMNPTEGKTNSQRFRLFTRSQPLLKLAIILFNIPETDQSRLLPQLKQQTNYEILAFNNVYECTNSVLDSYSDSEVRLILFTHSVMNEKIQLLLEFLPQIEKFIFVDHIIPQFMIETSERVTTSATQLILTTIKEDESLNENHRKQRSFIFLSEQSNTFIWFQFLFRILSQLEFKEIDLEEFKKHISSEYGGNHHTENDLEEFSQNYSPENAITWYTRETFFYQILNCSLRENGINSIFRIRFLFCDIIEQLRSLQQKQFQSFPDSLVVYRGQFISSKEIHRLIDNIGRLTSIRSFFSTALSIEVAKLYAYGQPTPALESIILKISIPANSRKATYAKISELSYFSGEDELLISMHSLFKINNVSHEMEYWLIEMTLIDEDNIEFSKLADAWSSNFKYRDFFVQRDSQLFYRDISEENGLFNCFLALIDIILRLNRTDFAMKDLVNTCQVLYANDSNELNKIAEFEKTYNPEMAANWYTKDSFMYRLLNESLRLEDLNRIFRLRAFIYDLHNQLAVLYKQYVQTIPSDTQYLTFYRGVAAHNDELEYYRKNCGSYVAFNHFLSTTTHPKTAIAFSGDNVDDTEVSMIYKITVDLKRPYSLPFAPITLARPLEPSAEDEVLFSIGATFLVGQTVQMEENRWSVELTLADKDTNWEALIAHLDDN